MCTTAFNFIIEGSKFRLFCSYLAWDYTQNELLVTFLVRNRTYGHDFPRVQIFGTKFLHTRLSVGGASLLENWILEGGKQGNFSVNAFVFICIVLGLNFLGAKL